MTGKSRFGSIGGEDLYRRMAMGDPLTLIDVRAESEFAQRHIPGSLLIPLPSLESRLSELPDGGVPIAVICEQGIRSVSACQRLAEHGIGPLFNVTGGLAAWPGPLNSGLEGNGHLRHGLAPSLFLVDNFPLLRKGLALDLAMGYGRNAIYLATRGFDVDGVDARREAVDQARVAARKLGAPIRAILGNVEDGTYIIPIEAYDTIVVFNYLHRPLFPDIKDGVVPGGTVIYQTFTREQARLGRPRNPDYLLEPGELRERFSGWEILRSLEFVGPRRGGGPPRALAAIVARKPE